MCVIKMAGFSIWLIGVSDLPTKPPLTLQGECGLLCLALEARGDLGYRGDIEFYARTELFYLLGGDYVVAIILECLVGT